MNFKFLKNLVIMLLCLTLTGCSSAKKTSTQKVTDKNELVIATSFYPIYISTINVTKDIPNVKVVNMTKPFTGCLHDYILTTDDLKKLEQAKVLVINGAGMESFMDKVIKQQPNLKIVDASKGIELINNKSDGKPNPHVWVSISNTILQVDNIAKQLASYDSINADKYKQNADTYITKLVTERAKMHKVVDKFKNRDIITFHESFPYFAKEFNLNVVTIIEREPGSEPSAREIKETIDIVEKYKVKALFAEPQYPVKAAEMIARETEAKVYVLDPAVTGESNEDAYIKIMDKNLQSLQEALK